MSILRQFFKWAEKYRRLKVTANAETPEDVHKTLELGTEDIGLCRTKHVFFEDERITVMWLHDLTKAKKNDKLILIVCLSFKNIICGNYLISWTDFR